MDRTEIARLNVAGHAAGYIDPKAFVPPQGEPFPPTPQVRDYASLDADTLAARGLRHAYIALGSNLENPAEHVRDAFAELDASPGVRLVAKSSLYRTAPMGDPDQPDYVNAAAHVETSLTPLELLGVLHTIEARHGRIRTRQNAPRTLDLDIILFDAYAFSVPGLTLPHSRAHTRAFVLAPLVEVAPELVIPGRGKAAELLALCGEQRIERLDE